MAKRGPLSPVRLAKRTADRVLVTLFGPRWLQFRARRVWDRHARTRSLEATSSHDATDADTYWRSGERDWGLVLAVANQAGLPARASAIEIGCGLGRLTRLAAADFNRVIGLDVSPEMLKQARIQANAANISYELVGGDGRIPSAAESVDLVYAWTVFRHMSKEMFGRYLDEARRILKPGGCLAFEALIRDTGQRSNPSTSDPDTEREYDSEELEAYAKGHGYEWAADQVIPSLTEGTHNLVIGWRKR
jgi:ubiquinone/menaquinone biosynthesis C-methylase UbiE